MRAHLTKPLVQCRDDALPWFIAVGFDIEVGTEQSLVVDSSNPRNRIHVINKPSWILAELRFVLGVRWARVNLNAGALQAGTPPPNAPEHPRSAVGIM